MTNTNQLPNFICIGAQRAGTTWLYENLKKHPEVFLPDIKELRFFNYNYDKGLNEYSKFFSKVMNEKAIGEITPDYYRQNNALQRIANDLPNIKLIFIIRNPIERAYSHYELLKSTGSIKVSFRQAITKNPGIIEYGKYGKHLENIYSLFDHKNVKVIEYDIMSIDPKTFLKEIYQFLDIDESYFPPEMNKKYNKILYPRSQNTLNKLKLGWLLEFIKKTNVGEFVRKINRSKKPKYRKDDIDILVNAFEQDLNILNEIIGKDYSYWLKKYQAIT
jgi:hypothetical protein